MRSKWIPNDVWPVRLRHSVGPHDQRHEFGTRWNWGECADRQAKRLGRHQFNGPRCACTLG